MKLFYPISILFVSMLFSCATLETISLDQLYPAEASFPNEVKNVAVVNNMIFPSPCQDDKLSRGVLYGDGKKMAELFSAALADNNYFNQIVICDSALRTTDDIIVDRKLSQYGVDDLLMALNSDMLLSFDIMNVRIKNDKYYYPGIPDPFPVIRVDAYALLRAYVARRSRPILSVTVHDSLFWDVRSGVIDSVVIDEASRQIAGTMVTKIVPQWKNIDRVYFDGACAELRDGAVSFRENDNDAAMDSWKSLYDRHKKGGLKVKAAFNLALLSELEGDIDAALSWLKKADSYASEGSEEKFLIIKYMDVLWLRKEDMSKLRIQMQRFDPK